MPILERAIGPKHVIVIKRGKGTGLLGHRERAVLSPTTRACSTATARLPPESSSAS
jgi:hypothetical protein